MTSIRQPSYDGTRCAHARGHIVDSHFYGSRYATAASRRIFCDVCRNQRWLRIEAALAAAQADLGMIPRVIADDIDAAADLSRIDLDVVQAEIERSGHSLVGLLRVLQAACPDGAGEFIHLGATTQDIQDTGQVLEMRDVLDELAAQLDAIVGRLAELAAEHATTVAVGRTHARPALPIGFGLKVASWLDETLRHAARIESMPPRVLVAQLFGGAGTMAGFGTNGEALLERFAARLGLDVPTIGWHVARDRVVEFVSTLAMVAGTMSRIAEEVRILGRPEYGEVVEDWQFGKVGSSTMPHKRNPEQCEQVVVMAKLAAAQVGVALAGMAGDHERDSRTLRVEWACVPDVSHFCLAACEMTGRMLAGLTVDTNRVRRNVDAVADEITSERLMLALGEHLGKQTAHACVYAASQEAYERQLPLRRIVAEKPELVGLLGREALDRIFDPGSYLGAAPALTRRVVAEAAAWLSGRQARQSPDAVTVGSIIPAPAARLR